VFGDRAIEEPLVVGVPREDVVTSSSLLWSFQSKSIRVEDLSVARQFSMRIVKKAKLNAFAIWFDVGFVGPEKQVHFTTSPFGPHTSYYQTVCYLRQPVRVSKGGTLLGTITLNKNAQNIRNVDIRIDFTYGGSNSSNSYLFAV
jgi:hypothetical protein